MNGFLLINKPKKITTYDIIRKIKRFFPNKIKIGHSGTLDPFATGLVIIAIGKEFTKQLHSLQNLDKKYDAIVTFGKETDSYDIDGNVTYTHDKPIKLSLEELNHTINTFKGTILQTPPIYSAKKINGTPSYKLARKGKDVTLDSNEITIYNIQLNNYTETPAASASISIHCSKGTYIRSLAYDIGKALTVGGYLSSLNRTNIGQLTVSDAVSLDAISESNIKEYIQPTLIT